MKSCPTCNRTYPDDAQVFCLMDGSVLSAPYDPAAATSRDSSPPPTQVMSRGAGTLDTAAETMRVTAPSPPATTIQAPPPAFPAKEIRATPTGSKSNRRVYFGLAVVAVFVVAVGLVAILIATQSRSRSVNRVDLNVSTSNASASSTPKFGGRTLEEAMNNKEASLREQLSADPNNPKLNASLAQLLSVEGRYAESERVARESIRLDPNASAPHYILSFVLEKQNKKAESQAERKKADELAAKGQ
jgi:hypothetical protein